MASMTLAQAQELLNLYIACEKAILKGAQSYTIKDRTYNRAELTVVSRERARLQGIVNSIVAGGSLRVRKIIPRDL